MNTQPEEIDMGDLPLCSTEKLRKARKDHKCSNCESDIMTGDEYMYISGVWDKPLSFKICLNCDKIISGFRLMHKHLRHEDAPSLGLHGISNWFLNFTCRGWNGENAKKDISRLFDVPMDYVNRIIN
jgi:hypothetical protein